MWRWRRLRSWRRRPALGEVSVQKGEDQFFGEFRTAGGSLFHRTADSDYPSAEALGKSALIKNRPLRAEQRTVAPEGALLNISCPTQRFRAGLIPFGFGRKTLGR